MGHTTHDRTADRQPQRAGPPAAPAQSRASFASLWALNLPLTRQFQIISLLVLLGGMLSTGWWLGQQIEERIFQHSLSITTISINSFVAPLLQKQAGPMSPAQIAALDALLGTMPIGEQMTACVVWGQRGQILYSTDKAQIGLAYPPNRELADAFAGQASWDLAGADNDDHLPPQVQARTALSMYTPVRQSGGDTVIAVVEFYSDGAALLSDIEAAKQRTWLVIGAVTIVMYLLLVGLVRRASDMIERQRAELRVQVLALTELLSQNTELRTRMQRATHRAATLNERLLRGISADLHDGPAQYLGLAMLHLDRVATFHEQHPDPQADEHLAVVQSSLSQAIREIRSTAAGLGLPWLDNVSVAGVVEQAVQMHEYRSSTLVAIQIDGVPEQARPSIKTTLYRVLQEGLSNAYRHGRGIDQQVVVSARNGALWIELSDGGPGCDPVVLFQRSDHLGLAGMRDRVESLGGRLSVWSRSGQGTRLTIELPLDGIGGGE
jgi:signal transduction histidine kinase